MKFTLNNGAIAYDRGADVWVQMPDGLKRKATPEEVLEFYRLQDEYWNHWQKFED